MAVRESLKSQFVPDLQIIVLLLFVVPHTHICASKFCTRPPKVLKLVPHSLDAIHIQWFGSRPPHSSLLYLFTHFHTSSSNRYHTCPLPLVGTAIFLTESLLFTVPQTHICASNCCTPSSNQYLTSASTICNVWPIPQICHFFSPCAQFFTQFFFAQKRMIVIKQILREKNRVNFRCLHICHVLKYEISPHDQFPPHLSHRWL